MFPFLRLEDLVAPPPVPALLSIVLVLGLARLGFSLGQRLRPSDFEPADGLLATVLVAAVLGAAIHGLALAGALSLWPLRIASWTVAAIGLSAVVPFSRWLRREVPVQWTAVRKSSLPEQALAAFLVITAAGFLLGVLGPVTDANSVDYHLGVVLDWLRHGGAYPRSDWFDARLVGLGEALNLLGLAGGTDGLGAGLQAFGVVVAGAAATLFCRTIRERLLGLALVLSSPILSELVPTQKPQFLPAAAGVLALALVIHRSERLDRPTLALALAAFSFALGCKLSFLLTVPILLAVLLVKARQAGQLSFAIGSAMLAFGLLAAPIFLRNWWFYGDPVSPLLERWRSSPDPAIVGFANELHHWEGPLTLANVGTLCLHALGWRSPIGVRPLGLGILIPLVSWGRAPKRTHLLLIGGALTLVILALGQLAPRFFLEPYLLAAVAFGGGNGWTPNWTLLALALAQGSLGAARAMVVAAFAFPGALTPSLRRQTMLQMATGAAESRWLERVTRPDDVVLAEIYAGAIFPRRFVANDALETANLPQPEEARRLAHLLTLQGGVTIVVVRPDDPPPQAIIDLVGEGTSLGPPETFFEVLPRTTLPSLTPFLRSLTSWQAFVSFVRDPWWKPPPFRLQAFRLSR